MKQPFQTKEAVRSMFDAAETLCKVLRDHTDDLNEGTIRKRLQPVISRAYGAMDTSAQSFAQQTLAGFVKWVNARHKYRHGPKTEAPHDPPLELAVAFLSAGASYIRFLIDVHSKRL